MTMMTLRGHAELINWLDDTPALPVEVCELLQCEEVGPPSVDFGTQCPSLRYAQSRTPQARIGKFFQSDVFTAAVTIAVTYLAFLLF